MLLDGQTKPPTMVLGLGGGGGEDSGVVAPLPVAGSHDAHWSKNRLFPYTVITEAMAVKLMGC